MINPLAINALWWIKNIVIVKKGDLDVPLAKGE
jgi:hypothetical protein